MGSGIKFATMLAMNMNKNSAIEGTKSQRRKKMMRGGIIIFKDINWGFIFEDTSWHLIDKVRGCQYCFSPKLLWNIHLKNQGTCYFKKMTIFSFRNSILLWSINIRRVMNNTGP